MKLRFSLRSVACILLVALLLSLSACGLSRTPQTPEEKDAKSFEELIEYLTKYAYYPLPEDFDTTGLTREQIVAATGDRYARYFTSEEYAAYSADLGGNLVGIGVSITQYGEGDSLGIHVLSVFSGSPAEAAGMVADDVITAIDGIAVSTLGYQDALSAVAGDAGTSLTLTCLRDGVPVTLSVTRDACIKQTVHSRILTIDGLDVGYVYITEFDSVTTLQFVNACEALEASGIDRILFDLRGNPGGYLHTVCEMLAYALPDGDISHIDYGYEKYEDYTIYSKDGELHEIGSNTMADGRPLPVAHSFAHLPVGILIDEGTASAAELFTSAFRDYAAEGKMNVTIFGKNSYGKGSMQSSFALSNGDHVKMTLALYNPPSNVNYDGVGIAPSEGCAIDTPHESVVPRFLGGYDDIGTKDAAMLFALNALTR